MEVIKIHKKEICYQEFKNTDELEDFKIERWKEALKYSSGKNLYINIKHIKMKSLSDIFT